MTFHAYIARRHFDLMRMTAERKAAQDAIANREHRINTKNRDFCQCRDCQVLWFKQQQEKHDGTRL